MGDWRWMFMGLLFALAGCMGSESDEENAAAFELTLAPTGPVSAWSEQERLSVCAEVEAHLLGDEAMVDVVCSLFGNRAPDRAADCESQADTCRDAPGDYYRTRCFLPPSGDVSQCAMTAEELEMCVTGMRKQARRYRDRFNCVDDGQQIRQYAEALGAYCLPNGDTCGFGPLKPN